MAIKKNIFPKILFKNLPLVKSKSKPLSKRKSSRQILYAHDALYRSQTARNRSAFPCSLCQLITVILMISLTLYFISEAKNLINGLYLFVFSTDIGKNMNLLVRNKSIFHHGEFDFNVKTM